MYPNDDKMDTAVWCNDRCDKIWNNHIQLDAGKIDDRCWDTLEIELDVERLPKCVNIIVD